ncbi:hypothetical protein BX666DRAFT_1915658 [Dichotomocladium elegans]|nr:hypothetical protein BX666DRAFT_1915658 [Dichotomocladium elegans]
MAYPERILSPLVLITFFFSLMSGTGIIAIDFDFPETVQFFAGRPTSERGNDVEPPPLALAGTTYPRRQKLRGKLRIVISQPIMLSLVEIRFHGQTELTWRDPLKSEHSLLAERMSARKTLRKSKSTLLEDAMLPAGVTELGFEITVPGHLCPTYKSKYLNVIYLITAKIVPASSKLGKKPLQAEREVRIEKTLMPHDVATGQISGYIVPRLTMSGFARRPGMEIHWGFRVPRWVCLEKEWVDFEGVFSISYGSSSASAAINIAKIQVDVVQQSFYHYELRSMSTVIVSHHNECLLPISCYSYLSTYFSEDTQDLQKYEGSVAAFGERLTKRHLLSSHNEPSTYLFPPLDTLITFSFPIPKSQQYPEEAQHRIKSVPFTIPKKPEVLPSTLAWVIDDPHYYSPATIVSKGSFSYSLDSPFLEIRHYIRLIIHLRTPNCHGEDIKPICIGLPVHITPYITATITTDHDELPTYNNITRHSERLPDYAAAIIEEEENVRRTRIDQLSRRSLPNGEVDISDLYRPSRRRSDNPALAEVVRRKHQHTEHVLIQERRIEDFWIKP